jgi:hypothetical protein
MFSAHAIHVLLRNTLIFFIILFIGLFSWLSLGIEIDTLKFSKYRVEGLYLKLDKKLTLKADKVIIPQRKANPSVDRIDETLDRIKYVLTFFEHINLKEIGFNNNILAIYYRDNILQLSSKDYLIRGNIHREGKMLKGTVPILQLKKYNIAMRGEFSYDLHEDTLETSGKFLFKKIAGDFLAVKESDTIEFSLKSDTFSDLRSVIDEFSMSEGVKAWVVDKVQAKSYKLLSLSGKGDIKDRAFKMDMEALRGEILFSDVSIDFKKGVAPVLAPSFILSYSDKGGLFFDLEKPRYLGKNLDGSTVSIVNLRDDNTTLNLNLKLHTSYDEKVQSLLHAYAINIPVLQKSGKVDGAVDIDIGLKNNYKHFVTDVNFTKGEVLIQKVSIPVVSGNLRYENGFVVLHNMLLENKYYAGILNGTLDVKKKKLQSIFDVKYLRVGEGEERLIDLKKQKIPFILGYKKGINVEIPKFTLSLLQKNKEYILSIKDLNKIKPYLSDEIPIEEGGEISIITTDFKNYQFKGILRRNSCFLYEKNNVCETKVPFQGDASATDVNFYAFNKRLHFNKAKSRIKLHNLNIDLKKFLETESKKSKKVQKKKKSNSIVILGTKSNLRYGEYSLITDSYDVEIKPNGDIKAIGSTDGDIIKFTKKKDILSLQALRIKDKVLHPLINFDGLQHGRYSITKTGNPEKVMKGEIIVEGGVMKDFKAYNNTLAFVNTLPALATLHKPGYSNEGFTITSGVIDYRMVGRSKIIFDSIYIKGDSATIVGKGELDLEKKTINVELAIQVARELGKALGRIPLVGYILVGKDQSLTVGLQITGTLDKPNVSVSAAKDILSYPLELIKRTIESPGQLLAPEK